LVKDPSSWESLIAAAQTIALHAAHVGAFVTQGIDNLHDLIRNLLPR
jgi:hypothetical protein